VFAPALEPRFSVLASVDPSKSLVLIVSMKSMNWFALVLGTVLKIFLKGFIAMAKSSFTSRNIIRAALVKVSFKAISPP